MSGGLQASPSYGASSATSSAAAAPADGRRSVGPSPRELGQYGSMPTTQPNNPNGGYTSYGQYGNIPISPAWNQHPQSQYPNASASYPQLQGGYFNQMTQALAGPSYSSSNPLQQYQQQRQQQYQQFLSGLQTDPNGYFTYLPFAGSA